MESRYIDDHPILGAAAKVRTITFYVDAQPIKARDGDTIASALVAAGWVVFRKTEKRHEPRGIFCAIGKCTDCVMTVDGIPNVRTCITPVRQGMQVKIQDGLGQWVIK